MIWWTGRFGVAVVPLLVGWVRLVFLPRYTFPTFPRRFTLPYPSPCPHPTHTHSPTAPPRVLLVSPLMVWALQRLSLPRTVTVILPPAPATPALNTPTTACLCETSPPFTAQPSSYVDVHLWSSALYHHALPHTLTLTFSPPNLPFTDPFTPSRARALPAFYALARPPPPAPLPPPPYLTPPLYPFACPLPYPTPYPTHTPPPAPLPPPACLLPPYPHPLCLAAAPLPPHCVCGDICVCV